MNIKELSDLCVRQKDKIEELKEEIKRTNNRISTIEEMLVALRDEVNRIKGDLNK